MDLLPKLDPERDEARSRLITLSPYFPLEVVSVILSACHALHAPRFLTLSFATFLLSHAVENGLLGEDDQSTHAFKSVVAHAMHIFLSGITIPQGFATLVQAASLKCPPLDDGAIQYIVEHWNTISSKCASGLAQLPSAWILKVVALLKERPLL